MAYTRREFIATSLNAGVGTALLSSAAAAVKAVEPQVGQSGVVPAVQKRPNILVLFPDQWRPDWMSNNPELPIRTPNLDRLARMGTRFSNAVVASPLCAPSRACLASGMEYDRCLTPSTSSVFPYNLLETFYGALRDGGYHTLGCGKIDLAKGARWFGLDGKWKIHQWGFSDGINNAGKFDQLGSYRLNNQQPADPYTVFLQSRSLLETHFKDLQSRTGSGDYGNTDPTPLPQDAYCDDWVTRNALKLLEEAPKDKPWFMQVNWVGPHDPEDITRRMEPTVRGRSMPAVNGKNKFDDAKNQLIRQNYTAMCENLDKQVGILLDKLNERGELENTIIVFSSDHGEMLGDHGRWAKSVPYRASVGVPLIIAGPGIQKGVDSRALVTIMDFGATFLDFAGLPATKNDSRSMRPLLTGQASTHRDILFSGLGSWRMAFDGRYKVVSQFDRHYPDPNGLVQRNSKRTIGLPDMVFDLEADPAENNDLGANPPTIAKQLLELVKG